MNRKVISYLGFAKKSGNLLTGVNTCSFCHGEGKGKTDDPGGGHLGKQPKKS